MSIWIEKTAASPYLCYRFSQTITLEDLDQLADLEEPYFAALGKDECLGIIVDLSAIDTIAVRLFPQLQQMRMLRDERVCAICVIGANPYLRAFTISLGLVHSNLVISFQQSIDEAISVLDRHLQRASSDDC